MGRFGSDIKITKSYLLAIFSVIILFLGSVVVWNYVNDTAKSERAEDFESLTEDQINSFKKIADEAVNFLYDLRGGITLGEMNGTKWRNFMFASGLEQRYPGIMSFSYEEIINKQDETSFVDKLKKEETALAYSSYVIFPSSSNAQKYPIKYLYTYDQDLSLLLGYDVGTSEIQLAAIREAVLNGTPYMTTLFSLGNVVQNSQKSDYVITLPVYSNVLALELSPSERQKFLVGFVNVWIKPESLFGYVAKDNSGLVSNLAYSVKDGDKEVFSYQQDKVNLSLKTSKEINIYGRDFTVDFSGVKTDVISSLIDNLPTYAFIVLLLMNLLWDLTMLGMIVARKRAQRAADLATKDLIKFKQAVDGVSDLVIITDPDAKILYANNASKKITGYDKKEIIGKNPSLWGKRMDTDFYEHFWKTLKVDKKVFNGEITNKRKNGEVYEAELSVWPILGEKKELIYLVGIERDISKTKAVERMKTEFISLASHQLRTPLSAVKWFGKMLADGEAGPLSKTQAEYLNKINESNEREIQLVNSLLNVSRIESGKIKLSPKPTDIRSLVEATVSDVRVGLNNKKRKILVDMPKDIPLVEVDPDLMRHVYMNLLMNAVNYSDENDSIKIDISLKDGEMITKISDTGIGIPAAEKTRIFEKFFRGSNALKKETDGSGLGLYLTKTIIESSGGKIWFESKENMGTTFWFTIPIESGKMI